MSKAPLLTNHGSMWPLVALVVTMAGPVSAQQDLGFRYRDGKCVNEAGEEGMNPEYPGECGDLKGANLAELPLDGVDFSGANLRGHG